MRIHQPCPWLGTPQKLSREMKKRYRASEKQDLRTEPGRRGWCNLLTVFATPNTGSLSHQTVSQCPAMPAEKHDGNDSFFNKQLHVTPSNNCSLKMPECHTEKDGVIDTSHPNFHVFSPILQACLRIHFHMQMCPKHENNALE